MRSSKYDELYKSQKNALGAPFAEFTDFFAQFSDQKLRVLDLGCGQGRDAVFIARLGHQVLGVDISPAGIAELREIAKSEGLSLQGEIADIVDYHPSEDFDVIILDRVLHMLGKSNAITVLSRAMLMTRRHGYILLADEKSNIEKFERAFLNDLADWQLRSASKTQIIAKKI